MINEKEREKRIKEHLDDIYIDVRSGEIEIPCIHGYEKDFVETEMKGLSEHIRQVLAKGGEVVDLDCIVDFHYDYSYGDLYFSDPKKVIKRTNDFNELSDAEIIELLNYLIYHFKLIEDKIIDTFFNLLEYDMPDRG